MTRLAVAVVLAAAAIACSKGPPPRDAPFVLAASLLDQDRSRASELIDVSYPHNVRLDGALNRRQITEAADLREIIVFADVRSGRVASVVLKFRADLSGDRRRGLLDRAGVPQVADLLAGATVVEATDPLGRMVRVRRADKHGLFTVTVEGRTSVSTSERPERPRRRSPTGATQTPR